MAGIYKQKDCKSYLALWKDDAGRNIRKSTFVPISQPGKREAQTRKEAQAIAEAYEAVYKGRILYTKQAELFRTLAGPTFDEQRALNKRLEILRELGSAGGTARKMPTIREFFNTFHPAGAHHNITAVKSVLARFVSFLGKAADARLDRLTRDQCQDFVTDLLKHVRSTTAHQYRAAISAALNTAIEAELLVRNPMRSTKIPRDTVEPIRRDALTPPEIARFLSLAPQRWKDMVYICLSTGGQRLGDCACLKWSSVDLAAATITICTRKTGAEVKSPLLEPLRSRLAALWEEREPGEEYVLPYMASRYMTLACELSVEFISLLEACGVATVKTGGTQGRRRQVHNKSFHSLRRGLVSMLRDGGASADMSRAIVGHSSEEVERAYYRATMEGKAHHLSQALQAITRAALPPTGLPETYPPAGA